MLLENNRIDARLPQLSIPRWTRAAKEITDLILDKWGLRSIVLDFLGERPGAGNIVLVEMVDNEESRLESQGYFWGSLDEISHPALTDQEQYIVQMLVSNGETGRGAFSRLGWIDEALDWVSLMIGVDRARVSLCEQLNGSATSTLIRLRGGGHNYWLKATGSRQAHEGRITDTLASLFPQYLPEAVAFHKEWNAWLMRDAGTPLSEGGAFGDRNICAVVRRLAELQRASTRHIPELLDSGCHDHRMATLRSELPELTPYLEEAMSTQDAQIGTRIPASRIRRVARLIEEASFRLEDTGIPDALVHCDVNLQNVLVGSRGCVFTDWAEASIGNPLITFEQIRIQVGQIDEAATRTAHFRTAYQHVWEDIVPTGEFLYASTLIPLIGLASTLCCRREWLTADSLHRPQSQSYARILARQMDRAAQVIEQSAGACA